MWAESSHLSPIASSGESRVTASTAMPAPYGSQCPMPSAEERDFARRYMRAYTTEAAISARIAMGSRLQEPQPGTLLIAGILSIGGWRRRVGAYGGQLGEQGLGAGAAQDAQARKSIWILAMGRPARDDRGRADIAGGLHLGDHRSVVVAGGVAEPVHRHVIAALHLFSGERHLFVQGPCAERDQIGVTDALGVELPTLAHELCDLCSAEAALRGR